MAEQSLKNHSRLDPAMHFFVQPILLLYVIFTIWQAIHAALEHSSGGMRVLVMPFVSLALLVFSIRTRANDLKLQDRIIRLEERLRLTTLLPPADLAHLHELSTTQLISLRFASDEEIPALVHRTLTQNLDPKAIKQNIAHWRADHHRV